MFIGKGQRMVLSLVFRRALIVAVAGILNSCGYAPTHEIPAKPMYIQAGVKPGDTIVVTTKDGIETTMVVSEVRAMAIAGEGKVIQFRDIEAIAVRSWKEPEHPCGAGEPVGCSIPEVVLTLSEDYGNQADKFHPACVIHDFCYRHGFATYGTDRATCDDNFYQDMQERCKTMGALSVLDIKEYTLCQTAALQTYEAVRRYGQSAYRTTGSTVCEY
jgi:hypothetical protein